MFWGREKQEKGLLIRSAQAAQWKRVMRRVSGESAILIGGRRITPVFNPGPITNK
jgi:hypothetical protein